MTYSIASNSGRFAWSSVGIVEGSTLRVTTFLLCNFLNKNALTSVRLFYSHTTYFAARLCIATNVKQGFTVNCYLPVTDIYKKHICFMLFKFIHFMFIFSFCMLYFSTLCVPYFSIVLCIVSLYVCCLLYICILFYRPPPLGGNTNAVNKKYIVT